MLAAQTQPQRREPFTDGPDRRRTGPAQLFLWFYVSIAGSLLLWLSVFDFESGDYRLFPSRWSDLFLEHGRWRGLAVLDEHSVSYPPLYLYLLSLSTLLPLPKLYAIKLLSVAADYVAAWYVWRLVRRHVPSSRRAWGP